MQKLISFLLVTFFLLACATPMKPVDPNSTFDTGIGFSVQPPPNGPWYEIKSPDGTGYILGREPSNQDKKDGSSVIAEVRWGYINLSGLKLKSSQDIFKYFETGMKDKSNTDRFEDTKSNFKPTRFKNAECLSFEQTSKTDKMYKSKSGESMDLLARGLMCLHPKDKSKYVRMGISQRYPAGKGFQNIKSDEETFFQSLKF